MGHNLKDNLKRIALGLFLAQYEGREVNIDESRLENVPQLYFGSGETAVDIFERIMYQLKRESPKSNGGGRTGGRSVGSLGRSLL